MKVPMSKYIFEHLWNTEILKIEDFFLSASMDHDW